MILAQKADLASKADTLLLVEGVDDWHTLRNTLVHIGGREPAFEIGYCGNDAAVLEMLASVVAGVQVSKSILGAVLDADADTGVARRIQDMKRLLGPAYEMPEAFPAQGLILRPKRSRPDRERLPTIGVWLMPDNQHDGMLEDLLRLAMTSESEAYISAVVDKAKSDGMTGFRDVERSKAIVRTHIAWQDPNKKNLGEAIGTHFENLVPACAPFLKWLESLFGRPE